MKNRIAKYLDDAQQKQHPVDEAEAIYDRLLGLVDFLPPAAKQRAGIDVLRMMLIVDELQKANDENVREFTEELVDVSRKLAEAHTTIRQMRKGEL